MNSKCCNASPSDLNEELCGVCQEHTDFNEEQEQSKFDSDRQKNFMDNYRNEISNKELEDLMNMFYNQ
tara:strand:- start:827 stop:1030 length:204 start_codon:yes stop_codon:yes gene_type:complete